MPEKLRIALDCMGGDFGASVVLTGAELSLKRVPRPPSSTWPDIAYRPALAGRDGTNSSFNLRFGYQLVPALRHCR